MRPRFCRKSLQLLLHLALAVALAQSRDTLVLLAKGFFRRFVDLLRCVELKGRRLVQILFLLGFFLLYVLYGRDWVESQNFQARLVNLGGLFQQ